MAEKKQVYSCHKTSYPDSSFFLPAMSPLSTLILMEYSLRLRKWIQLRNAQQEVLILILMEYSLRQKSTKSFKNNAFSLNPYSNGI